MMQSRAMIRRALRALPDAGRLALAPELAVAPEVAELVAAYMLDPRGGAILATTDDRARALAAPIFEWVGPGNAAPLDDQLAALIAGPLLVRGDALSPLVARHRWAPRADDAVACAVAALDEGARPRALEQLAADAGPDAATLALSTVQCGRVLAWSPSLLALASAEPIVDALLELLVPARPRPLLELVARALGPLAAQGRFAERIVRRARAGLDTAAKPQAFSAELADIGKTRALPDQDRWMALPARECAAACAYILGFAAPQDRDAFVTYRTAIVDRDDAPELMQPFVDGMIAAAHVPAVTELAIDLFDSGDADAALALAAQLPLDPIAPVLVAALDAPGAGSRALAADAVELLDHEDVDPALASRLSDPSPEVAAAAARTLLARGRRDLVARHSAHEAHPARRAVVLASLGERTVPVIGQLVRDVLAELEVAGEDVGPSPVTRLVADALLTSVEGLEVAADLVGGVPEAAGLLALAGLPGTMERDVAITAPPAARSRFADAVVRIPASGTDDEGDDHGELRALAIYLLARMSAGDADLAAVIADELTATDGYAATWLGALGELRVATAETAAAVAPHVAPDSPIGARVVAAAVCGRTLPADHPAWAHVRELLELGTIARAAAWSALRDRARRS